MDPESNQASATWGTRSIVPPHPSSGQGHAYRSISGRWGSKPSSSPPARSASSSNEPSTSRCSSSASHSQTGSGVPQYRSRERAQSTLFSSHSPIRPSPISSGCQSTEALCSSSRSFTAVVRMYHESRAM